MKVEKVNLKTYNNASKLRVRQSLQTNNTGGGGGTTPNFKGGIPQAELVKDIQKIMPTSIKFINRLADHMGEIQNICINAAGTGLVAPIFIKYNPLSKTDEDTRTYSAWRQPISAVLAVATQASMVAPFNNLTSWMSNVGYLDEYYNKTNFQDDSYLEKLIKKTNKNISEEQLKIAVNAEKTKQFNEFIENLKNKDTILIKQYKAPTKEMAADSYQNLKLETVRAMIKDDEEKLAKCDTKSEQRAIRSEFLRQENLKTKQVLNEIETKLKGFKTLPEYKSYLSKKIKSLKASNADAELIKMVKETLDRARNITTTTPEADKALMREMKNKISKMISHADKYSNVTEKQVKDFVEQSVKDRKTAYETSIKTLKELEKDLNEGNKISVSQIQKRIAEKLKEANLKETCSIKGDFAKEIYHKYKGNIEGSIKAYQAVTGLVISLAVLPITCCLLNWIYPKFMDAVFPNLSNKKHDNEASALVAKAPKKEEV